MLAADVVQLLEVAWLAADVRLPTDESFAIMSVIRYAVIREGAKWRVNLNGTNYGYYDDADAATQVAIETAQKAGLDGHTAQVLLETQPMQFRTVWTYGTDPAPKTVPMA